ncbi:uncharacterized protein LOC9637198 [Selaginella moellendorffii]|nr:uncharacterized protein LOC9637198 [Selaginella moellendorffii]|eukprot:XP_002974550.2 uncharacterized protein LOC9637198 [Selaginella moellendorffii]
MAKDDGAKQAKGRKRRGPAPSTARNLRSCTSNAKATLSDGEAKAPGSSEDMVVSLEEIENVVVAVSEDGTAPITPSTPAPQEEEESLDDNWKEVTRAVCYEMDADFSHGDGLPEMETIEAPPKEPITVPDDLDEGLKLLVSKNRMRKTEVFKLKLAIYQLYSKVGILEAANAAEVAQREELDKSKEHASKLQQELNEAVEELKRAKEDNAGLKARVEELTRAIDADQDEEKARKAEKLEKEIESLKSQIKQKNGVIALLRNSYGDPRASLAARQFMTP